MIHTGMWRSFPFQVFCSVLVWSSKLWFGQGSEILTGVPLSFSHLSYHPSSRPSFPLSSRPSSPPLSYPPLSSRPLSYPPLSSRPLSSRPLSSRP